MNFVSHFLVSWTTSDRFNLKARDVAVLSWLGLAPDLDGLGVVVDFANKLQGLPATQYYSQFHHSLLHGLAGALVLSGVAAMLCKERVRAFFCGMLIVHLHFLCDLVGSRGVTKEDVWPLRYFMPFSESGDIAWAGQWPLNGWQNVAIAGALFVLMLHRAYTAGRAPSSLFGARVHSAFLEVVHRRGAQLFRTIRK